MTDEPVPRVLIVYASQKGYTERAARAHADGVHQVGGVAELARAEEATSGQLEACDALLLGTPIHMGSADWRMKRFIDQVCGPLWSKQALAGKVGGAFVTGGGFGSAGGGVELCLMGLLCNLMQLGVLPVPLPRHAAGFARGGTPWGPYCRTQRENLQYLHPDELELDACRAHGAHVAQLAMRLGRSPLYSLTSESP